MLNITTVVGGSIGTNSYLLEENNKIVLIDFVPEVQNIIEENKFILDKILLTHTHFDHFEGLSNFQKKYNFELCLSKNQYNFLKNPDNIILSYFPPEVIKNINNLNLNNVMIYKDNDIINWNDHLFKVIESPGHSIDSLMFILDEKKYVFTGDNIFYGNVGRTDLPGGNFKKMINSIKNLFSLIDDNYIFFPGHGPKTFAKFEKEYNPFLKIDV